MKEGALKRRWLERYESQQRAKSPRLGQTIKAEPDVFPQHAWSDALNISLSAQSTAIFNRRQIGRTKVSDYSDWFPTWKIIARQAIVQALREWVLPAGTVNLEPHNATVNRYCEEFIIPPTDERVGLRGQLGIRAKTTILPFTPLGLYIGHYLCSADDEVAEHDTTYGSYHTESYYFDIAGRRLMISAFPEGNKLSLVNANTTHNVFPGKAKPENVLPVQVLYQGWPYIMYVTTEKPIAMGTELLLDYGEPYWKEKIAPIVVSDSESDDEHISPRSPSSIQPALSPDTTRPLSPTTVNVPQRLPTPPSATTPLPLAAPQPFSPHQPYPTHQPALLAEAAHDTGLRLIDMPPYGNNCLLFAILFSVQGVMQPICQSLINQALNGPRAMTPPVLLNLFKQFRAAIVVEQHVMMGKDHGERFIQWLIQQSLLPQAGYNLVEFHSVVLGGQSYCIREGRFIAGQCNIPLWNSGNHYQVVAFSSEQAFDRACYNAREITALFPRQSMGFTPNTRPRPSGLSAIPAFEEPLPQDNHASTVSMANHNTKTTVKNSQIKTLTCTQCGKTKTGQFRGGKCKNCYETKTQQCTQCCKTKTAHFVGGKCKNCYETKTQQCTQCRKTKTAHFVGGKCKNCHLTKTQRCTQCRKTKTAQFRGGKCNNCCSTKTQQCTQCCKTKTGQFRGGKCKNCYYTNRKNKQTRQATL